MEHQFNGSDYDPKSDNERLSEQHVRVRETMRDGRWRTLAELAAEVKAPEASVSAQLRHLRKERFGSWVIEKRSRGERSHGLFEYRLQPPGTVSELVAPPRMNAVRAALTAIWNFPETTEKQRDLIRSFFPKKLKRKS